MPQIYLGKLRPTPESYINRGVTDLWCTKRRQAWRQLGNQCGFLRGETWGKLPANPASIQSDPSGSDFKFDAVP